MSGETFNSVVTGKALMVPMTIRTTNKQSTGPKHTPQRWGVREFWLGVSLVLPLLFGFKSTAQGGEYTYTTNNGTIRITRYTGIGGTVTIPEAINGLPVTTLAPGSFSNNGRVSSVDTGNSVTTIEDGAFGYCGSLTNAWLGSGLTNLGSFSFAACYNLTNFTVHPLNPLYRSIDGVVFDKSQTTLIQAPAGITGNYFIPAGTQRVGDAAFHYRLKLTRVIIPDSITSIGDSAFFNCGLADVDLPNSVTSIENRAFSGDQNLTNVTFGNSITNIGTDAFNGCRKLTRLNVPNSVTTIGDYAFAGCTALTEVALTDSLDIIRSGMFAACSSLPTVTIPDGVTNIGDSAFYFCTSLTNVMLGKSVASVGNLTFSECASLTAIRVDPLNSVYSDDDGVLLNKSQTVLIRCPGGITGSYTIPVGVNNVSEYAFHACRNLTNIVVPNGVTTIGDSVFQECSSLVAVELANGITTIGASAFFACPALGSITIPEYLTNTGTNAFANCNGLSAVFFRGNAVTNMPSDVFNNSVNVTVYYLPGTTGWGPVLAERPTAIWELPYPVILGSSPGFGVNTNGFSFRVSWATNASVVLEASTELTTPNWTPLTTNALASVGWFQFTDPDWTSYPNRFYRIRSP